LPPVVLSLVREAISLRIADRVDRAIAGVRPVLGPGRGTGAASARVGRRRLTVAGSVTSSSQGLTHENGRRVSAAFDAMGVDAFVVDRAAEHLVFGVANQARGAAWSALRTLAGEGAWFVDWERGVRRGTLALSDRPLPRPLASATSWSIYRAWAAAGTVVGPDQATVLTFWEPGTSGKDELIGVRGQARFDPRSAATREVIDGHEYRGRAAFPVATNLERFVGDIDVVYTWVDGSDPRWLEAFDVWARREGRETSDDRDLIAGRFRDNDELRYSLRSLWFGCDWVRKIFIVTADQVPDWLDSNHGRIEVVPHSDLLPAACLPTFNSHAIETALHLIDDIAEHFIYFNDDVFVGRPIRPELLFTSGGLPKMFLSDARVTGVDDSRQLAVDNAAMRGRHLLARDLGRIVAHKPEHAPFALRRSLLDELCKRYAGDVEVTRGHRFRHPDDISVAASLAQSYAIATGQAVFGSLDSEYVHLESARLRWHLDRLLLGRRFDTFCLNETEVRAHNRAQVAATVARFLADYFPVASPWERGDRAP
jgi:hypothetical protein